MTEGTENTTAQDTAAENTARRGTFRLLDFQERCPDCDVTVGEAHIYDEVDGGCDVARCLVTGLQRLMCDLDGHDDCGRDVWTGKWPGLVFSELKTWEDRHETLPTVNETHSQQHERMLTVKLEHAHSGSTHGWLF